LGLAVTSKYMDKMLDRMFTYDFHQFISLLSIAFLLVHILILLVDRYLPYSLAQILVPFISPYRPFWVGIGVISFYVTLLVTITFYIKRKIGMRSLPKPARISGRITPRHLFRDGYRSPGDENPVWCYRPGGLVLHDLLVGSAGDTEMGETWRNHIIYRWAHKSERGGTVIQTN
jgi:hypothetical protein